MRPLTLALLLTLLTLNTAADAEETAPQPGFQSLAWLTGHWSGEALGGQVDEHWTAPAGGTMLGVFRLASSDATQITEYMMITQEEGGLVYRFMHWRPDYTTWDARPLTFHLASVEDGAWSFESPDPEQTPRRLVYRRDGEDGLVITVESAGAGEGEVESFDVRLRRQP